MGLPEPDLKVVDSAPDSGSEAPFDWSDDTMSSSAAEVSLDLQWAHAMAPDAKLVLYQLGADPKDVDDQIAPEALAQLIEVLGDDVAGDGNTDVVSLSMGYPEQGPSVQGYDELYKDSSDLFKDMNEEGITVVASSGDNGVYDPNASDDNTQVRTVDWPSADPNVTAVGGTRLTLDGQGKRTKPDTVWNDSTGAPGGGLSAVFDQPGYQSGNAAAAKVGQGKRAVPDVSLTASGEASAMVYMTTAKGGAWHALGGTSLAAPIFSGILAVAAQQNDGGLGNVNPALYELAATPEDGARAGMVDITTGVNGKDGYRAAEGYDLASGLGTIDAAKFVPALAGKS